MDGHINVDVFADNEETKSCSVRNELSAPSLYTVVVIQEIKFGLIIKTVLADLLLDRG